MHKHHSTEVLHASNPSLADDLTELLSHSWRTVGQVLQNSHGTIAEADHRTEALSRIGFWQRQGCCCHRSRERIRQENHAVYEMACLAENAPALSWVPQPMRRGQWTSIDPVEDAHRLSAAGEECLDIPQWSTEPAVEAYHESSAALGEGLVNVLELLHCDGKRLFHKDGLPCAERLDNVVGVGIVPCGTHQHIHIGMLYHFAPTGCDEGELETFSNCPG
jgi:hypothetical protein